ncbi:hypothetical protein [Lacticaseibacillus brantae]|uniref:Beta-1,6-galactofuranosyltransferase n=1 Tax=Lacticaseibacillus brantae DSM 23927 TaxID=1423727 RepID=A0A0R2AWV3_9LACO|nr:hypothetical protein [Lacticaseibacillus brantae]KRM71162.1 beta-1,6-galactofuranosyltransferase [Lacticaseibacillus brantae DSM 23927]
MKKWICTFSGAGVGFDASAKSRLDISAIGAANGYELLHIFDYNDNGEPDTAKIARIDGITAAVGAGDIVVIQHPAWIGAKFDTFFIDQMNKRGALPILWIHDIDSWRFDHMKTAEKNSTEYFNKAAAIIVHGQAMADRLHDEGVNVPLILQPFNDYLDDDHSWDKYESNINSFHRSVVMAGNLLKSQALLLNWDLETPVIAFGATTPQFREQLNQMSKVTFAGGFGQWELANRLPHAFGLAWDSNMAGSYYEDYTHYNHPHKVSLYLSHGLPVIVSKASGVAPVIEANHLGFAIDDIHEIDQVIRETPDDVIADILDSTARVGRLLRDGWFTTNALLQAEKCVLDPKFVYNTEYLNQDNSVEV